MCGALLASPLVAAAVDLGRAGVLTMVPGFVAGAAIARLHAERAYPTLWAHKLCGRVSWAAELAAVVRVCQHAQRRPQLRDACDTALKAWAGVPGRVADPAMERQRRMAARELTAAIDTPGCDWVQLHSDGVALEGGGATRLLAAHPKRFSELAMRRLGELVGQLEGTKALEVYMVLLAENPARDPVELADTALAVVDA